MEQTILFIVILGAALFLFVWGRIRYDMVALLTLFVLVVTSLVPSGEAFGGFGHPAVITVAAVFIISRAQQYSGVVDLISQVLSKAGKNKVVHIVLLSVIVAFTSAFMNNIAALAILMPVAMHLARKSHYSPSYILMPIAFASILGGMTTLIGTPPNIIIATFRTDVTGSAFGMFEFTPVGGILAIAGLLFVVILGWRFIKMRNTEESADVLFHIENYITEVKVTETSKLAGKTIGEVNKAADTEVVVLGMIRGKRRIHIPPPYETLVSGDILIIEAETKDLQTFIDNTGVILTGNKEIEPETKGPENIRTVEAIVMAESPLVGETAMSANLRTKFRVNLLAVARQERQIWQRIRKITFRAGDVLLLHGRQTSIKHAMSELKCLPLAERGLNLDKPRKIISALGIFILSIAVVVPGLLPVHIAFSIAAVVMVLMGLLPLKEIYTSIEWPVIILLGAMIPVGEAFESSGGAELVSAQLLNLDEQFPLWFLLGVLMSITMLLSNVINNAATVVLMAPIGIHIATAMGVSSDPFLMAIAMGGSCAFLTPIGHQSNTLVMGPGGYKFSDYWKMGLPLSIIMLVVGIPVILYFWPA